MCILCFCYVSVWNIAGKDIYLSNRLLRSPNRIWRKKHRCRRMSSGKHWDVTAYWACWAAVGSCSQSLTKHTIKSQFLFVEEESSCAVTFIWSCRSISVSSLHMYSRKAFLRECISALPPPVPWFLIVWWKWSQNRGVFQLCLEQHNG